MDIRTEDIVNQEFSRAFLGYDIEEVDGFLDALIDRFEKLEAQRKELLVAMEYLLKKLGDAEDVSDEMKRAIAKGDKTLRRLLAAQPQTASISRERERKEPVQKQRSRPAPKRSRSSTTAQPEALEGREADAGWETKGTKPAAAATKQVVSQALRTAVRVGRSKDTADDLTAAAMAGGAEALQDVLNAATAQARAKAEAAAFGPKPSTDGQAGETQGASAGGYAASIDEQAGEASVSSASGYASPLAESLYAFQPPMEETAPLSMAFQGTDYTPVEDVSALYQQPLAGQEPSPHIREEAAVAMEIEIQESGPETDILIPELLNDLESALADNAIRAASATTKDEMLRGDDTKEA